MIIHLTDVDGGRVPATLVATDERYVTVTVNGHFYRFKRATGAAAWSITPNTFSIDAAELARL